MKPKLKAAFTAEMDAARTLYRAGEFAACFRHLERAHILGQRYYLPHLTSHYWMFKVGLRTRDLREIVGQILRMLASAGSLIGVVPVGNTGGANVPALKPMPIPADLQHYFVERQST